MLLAARAGSAATDEVKRLRVAAMSMEVFMLEIEGLVLFERIQNLLMVWKDVRVVGVEWGRSC